MQYPENDGLADARRAFAQRLEQPWAEYKAVVARYNQAGVPYKLVGNRIQVGTSLSCQVSMCGQCKCPVAWVNSQDDFLGGILCSWKCMTSYTSRLALTGWERAQGSWHTYVTYTLMEKGKGKGVLLAQHVRVVLGNVNFYETGV